MLVIGLTGGIGSGKSAAADIFAQHNVPIIDADIIARDLVQPGQTALQEITTLFGEHLLQADGQLDRARLRQEIFSDKLKKAQLEGILHPLIRQTMLASLAALDSHYAILVIPLLVENGQWDIIDRVLVVDVDEATQLQRVVARDQVTLAQAEAIIHSQVPRNERIAAADDIIDNSRDIAHLTAQVEKLHAKYKDIAQPHAQQPTMQATMMTDQQHIYEQPLNERIRTFLRLEHLFERIIYHIKNNTRLDNHAAINTLVEIGNLLNRGDLKSDVIKELERQTTTLKRHTQLPGVDQAKLKQLLDQQAALLSALHSSQEHLGQHLKSDLLYNSIRQRLSIPGGTCDFDLPIYRFWLNLSHEARQKTLQQWFTPFETVHQAIGICLDTIRNSADPKDCVAEKGYYEQTLDASTDIQLIRVMVDQQSICYPTISASKLRFNIRFLEWSDKEEIRSSQAAQNIDFKLLLCSF